VAVAVAVFALKGGGQAIGVGGLPVQVLLGVGWGSLYIGSVFHLVKCNAEHATSTGLLGSTMSLSAVVGSPGFETEYSSRILKT